MPATLLTSGCWAMQTAHSDPSSWWCKLKTSMWNRGGLSEKDKFPIYWESGRSSEFEKDADSGSGSEASFDDSFPVSMEDHSVLEALLNETSKACGTRYRLVRAIRVEKSELWHKYQQYSARLRRRRGACTFAGRGPPSTSSVLKGVRLADGFPEPLEDDICEAYLWHGTKPHTAMKILQQGFKVDRHSSLGKRFGRGGYFSEDAAKADSYAGAGEGIYKDCFAMLMCRVALGRQFRTDLFRWEEAAQQAGSRHDSLLAEPRGAAYREFVALEDSQIYPEFVLVYERVPVEDPMDGGPLRRCISTDHPEYWCRAMDGFVDFHAVMPDHEVDTCVQSLADLTWARAFTMERRDSDGLALSSHGGDPHPDMPEGIRVLRVLRIEASELWSEYKSKKAAIRQARARCLASKALAVKTRRPDLPLWARGGLASDVNEEYLWHGCSPQLVETIAESGFPLSPGCGGTGPCRGLFGEGYYFVDSAAKADEHSEDDKDGLYRGHYAMLLCRVILGNPQVLPGADPAAHQRVGPGREFDSSVGDQVASSGSFREYIVPERAQVYPEYAVIYERVYSVPRVR